MSVPPSICPAFVFSSSVSISCFCLSLICLCPTFVFAHPSVCPAFVFRSSVSISCFCLQLIHSYILHLCFAHPSVYPVFVFRSSIHMSYFCLPLIHLSNPNPFGTEEFVQFRQMFGLHRFKLHTHLVDETKVCLV